MNSIAPEADALRAHLSAAAVNRLAAAGGAPAGAVGLASIRALRKGVDQLHASLRTTSDRTMGEAMDDVVKVVKKLRRAAHMEDDIDLILNEVRAGHCVAFADKQFVFDDSDFGGQSARGSSAAAPLGGGAGADPGGVSLLKAENHHAPHRRRGGGRAACHR